MDFALTEEQTAIFDMAYAFGQDTIAPHARDWEKQGTIPKELWPQIAELGFGGLYVSEETGGSGLTRLDATLVFEALSMACPSVAAFLSIHNMCAKMIDTFASNEMKARLMPDILSMKTVLSYCLTEPGSGSDAAALKTRAERSNKGYTLNGTKAFISGGGYSDAYVVMVRTGEDGPKGISTVYVEDGTEGLSFGALEDKMGWRSQPTAQVQFDDCKITTDILVGEEGKGFKYAMAGLDGGRLNIGACSVGAAQASIARTIAYMQERKQFGKPLAAFQALQFRIADMVTELEAARLLLYKAAQMVTEKHPDATQFAAMAKRLATDTGFEVVNQALQLHGGYGYLRDYPIERYLRDLRVHQILEGTNEVMRLIVSRALLKGGE